MKRIIASSLLVASSILGISQTASAERLVTAVVADSTGIVYQVDLDNRSEYYTKAGWRHVYFWLTTQGDVNKHPAIASCAPYQVKADYYGFDWLPSGGYPAGTVGGNIARVACND